MKYNIKVTEVQEYTLNNIEAISKEEAEDIASNIFSSYPPDAMYITDIEVEAAAPAIEADMKQFNKYVCIKSFVGGTSPALRFMPGDAVLYIGKAENYYKIKFKGSEYQITEADLDCFALLNDFSWV